MRAPLMRLLAYVVVLLFMAWVVAQCGDLLLRQWAAERMLKP